MSYYVIRRKQNDSNGAPAFTRSTKITGTSQRETQHTRVHTVVIADMKALAYTTTSWWEYI